MKTLKRIFIGGVVVSLLSFAGPALAGTPSLSVSNEGGYDNVRITISNANPYSQITLNRRQGTPLWTTITNFGQTDGSGYYYSPTVSLGSDGSNNPVEQYVVVAGLQSSTVTTRPYGGGGCYGSSCGNYGNITFSETNPFLNVGQSRSISIYDSYSGNYYVSNNSNSNVVSVSVSGATLNLYAYQNGNSTITVCQSGYSSSCGSIYVTVSGGGAVGNITFSPQNPSLSVGQSLSVYVSAPYFYSGSYYISSNSNSGVVTASISDNNIFLYGNSAGNSTLSVCQSGGSYSCGSLYVTVSGSDYSGSLTFSQSYVNLNVNQSSNISIFGSSYSYGNYYVSSNSNYNVANASISGTALYLSGKSSGSTTVRVCQNNTSNCGTVYVTVSGSGGNYGYVQLSPSSVNMSYGQNTSVNIYSNNYSGSYYISSNSNSGVVSASITGSTLTLQGSQNGNSTITVCQSGYSSSCGSVYVTVTGSYYGGSGLYFLTGSLPTIVIGQYYSVQLQVSGGTSPYYFTVTSGRLPQGLSMNSNGLISGIPLYLYNNYGFTVRVTDNFGRSANMEFLINSSGQSNYGGGLSYPGSGNVLGSGIYSSGRLIKENGTVYVVYKNTKTGFANASAFTGLGFSFSNVTDAGISGLANSGYIVSSSRASHPWGSWVKNGQTVYFVHELGLIPVPSMDVFTNNGGQTSYVVPANSYDFSLPILSPMTLNDSRLR